MRALRAALLVVSFSLAVCGNSFGSAGAETKPLPKEAYETIAQLKKAAQGNDFAKLRSLMVDEFTWSFGGDVDANQAINAWRKDKRYLAELQATLKSGCHKTERNKINCPSKGGFDFRAGLVKTKAGWRMEYFVEGD
ncbi:MAG: hypothetical protein L0209_07010 [candidate division Zixibacteria bacterium]|nr:hypothetical protein [candidate division Zixibacteria bacterium]